MTITSNLYAEKVFSEQPLALWSLDDNADFLNIFPPEYSNKNSWSQNAVTFEIGNNPLISVPNPDAFVMEIEGVVPDVNPETLSVRYPSVANFNQLNHSFGSLSTSFYLSASGIDVSSVSVGVEYTDPATANVERIDNTYAFADNGWGFVGSTVNVPNIDAAFDIVIDIVYNPGAAGYSFLINSISSGQWAEGTQTVSVGTMPAQLPLSIATSETLGVLASPYGLSDSNGYYIATEKQLFARNTGTPMVYGTSNCTRVYAHSGPSIILPGFGVMNESGKYRETTVEFWLRADSYTREPRRILGPIGKVFDGDSYTDSVDGIYLHGEFIAIKLGKYSGSYFVGEWGRPMLISFRLGEKEASLAINGEDVISVSIDVSQISFPEKFIYDAEALEDKNQDWLGIYSYSDISVLDVDALGIYPYRVPTIVSKRRFVYGQGVDFPENLNTAYNGSSVFLDYSFSDYTNNYNYPDIGRWGQAASDNLSVTNKSISAPNYTQPSAIFRNQSITQDSWLDANNSENISNAEARTYITLRPTGWESENGYLFFNKLNSIGQDVAAVYGVFKPTENVASEQTLLYVENELVGNYFAITLTGNLIQYKFKYGNAAPQILYSVTTIVPDIAFSVGFNINNLMNTYGSNIKTFFGNKDQLKVYVGGTKSFDSTFSGKIYNVGFSTARNAKRVESFFNESGIAQIPTDLTDVFYLYFDESADGQIDFTVVGGYIDPISGSWISFEGLMDGGYADSFVFGRFQDHIASYTLVPIMFVDRMILDIAADSHWEDYIPLSYFSSYVSDGSGDDVSALDFLQFNISNPKPSMLGDGTVNTDGAIVKTFVTFQYLADGSNALDEYFIYQEPVSDNHIVSPAANWLQTKYEVVSGDTILLPSGADFNHLSIGVHIEMVNPGIKTHPVKITSLQIASQALNYRSVNPVGTRFGYDVYPYSRSGVYYNYKDIKPYSIYKGSTPYLYMSKHSGIKLCDNSARYGISIPINRSLVTDYAVGAIQFATQYQEGLFPEEATEIFEIQSSNFYAKFYVVASNASRTRGMVYGIDQETKARVNGLAYYLNGVLVKDLYLESDSWSVVGIQFADALAFEAEVGAIRLTGPMLFNNISYYQLPSTQTSLSVIFRRWNQLSELATYWDDLNTPSQLLWQDILYISVERSYTIDPSTIFREYSGTNRVLVTSDKTLSFKDYKYSVYKDVNWRSTVVIPV